ncbi:MAG: hypothetical protein QOG34_1199 [Frankiaceae bacterium]|nr:hypothetical protein [Frankiaceae bacterium]
MLPGAARAGSRFASAKSLGMRRTPFAVPVVIGLVASVLAGQGSGAATAPLALGAIVRVTTPGTSLCPAEGEPETAVTAKGIWVAYNDDHQCPLTPTFDRIEEVQLIPPQGKPVFIPLTARSGEIISGDPDLAPAGDGGVYLASLWGETNGAFDLRILRISPSLKVTELPTPSLHGANASDDKEFIAVDQTPGSRWRGHLYIAWVDVVTGDTMFRAWNGKTWADPVTIGKDPLPGDPDVTVGPHGTIAVAFTGSEGAIVRLSHDGGKTFGSRIVALSGAAPGRTDASCPLRPTVGVRQRAMMGPRVAFDRAGDLHLVAATGEFTAGFTTDAPTAALLPTSPAVVQHAVIHGTSVTHREAITAPSTDEQWAAALAPLPRGGVAVSWLQTNGTGYATYDAWIAVQRPGSRAFTAPQKLSTASSNFPAATEAAGNSNCYGIGDYIGMATTKDGVETVWPTTDTDTPGVDSDVLVRTAVAH